nr:T9SS type A sorting domain-containing protein [Bacteroidota bacterium]
MFNPHILRWDNPPHMNIANLCPGLYFIEINAGAKRMSTKFIKQ